MIDRTKNRTPASNHAARKEAVVVMKSRHASIAVSTEHARVPGPATGVRNISRSLLAGLLAVVWSLASPSSASASLLSHEAEDALANFLALFVLFVVPVVLITLFWLVHILPEKIAHKRHHPQFEAIRTLCLLSLAFGGLLWPLAWLWAYTKPVGYKMAYGTDKHPDYFKEHGLPEPENVTSDLKQRVAALAEGDVPASELDAIRADLAVLESRLAADSDRSEAS